MPGRDIIVIGASAGGITALQDLISRLPADLPATLFIVVHIPPEPRSILPTILTRAGPLEASHPVDSEEIKKRHIYVAPPNCHLLIEEGCVRATGGPRENRYRPAVDPLFRTAALAYGPRVVGVVLTGALDDGTAGLYAIKSRGGIAVVQDPDEAPYPSMPRSALANVDVDYCLPLAEIPGMLVRLAREEVKNRYLGPVPKQLQVEARIAKEERADMHEVAKLGDVSTYTCPECHGTLYEVRDGELIRFRCHVGHGYSTESLLAGQSEGVERALWAALRALEEKVALLQSLAGRSSYHRHDRAARQFKERAVDLDEQAELLRKVLEKNSAPGQEEAAG